MKNKYTLVVLLTCFFSLLQTHTTQAQSKGSDNPRYDSTLARKLGADAYGMKKYYLVILKTGSNISTDKDYINQKFQGHMNNIRRLVDEGKLVVAGPLGKNDKTYRGIFILQHVGSAEEARTLLQTDPAIEAKLLEPEIYEWYGSAALPEYLDASDRIWQKNH